VNKTSLFLFVGIGLGFVLPLPVEMGRVLPYLLIVILYYSYLRIEIPLRKIWHPVLLGPIFLNLLILPGILYLSRHLVEPLTYLGLLLIVAAPPAISAASVIIMLGGNVPLALANTIFSYVCSFFPIRWF